MWTVILFHALPVLGSEGERQSEHVLRGTVCDVWCRVAEVLVVCVVSATEEDDRVTLRCRAAADMCAETCVLHVDVRTGRGGASRSQGKRIVTSFPNVTRKFFTSLESPGNPCVGEGK